MVRCLAVLRRKSSQLKVPRACWCDVAGQETRQGAGGRRSFGRGDYGQQRPNRHDIEGAVGAPYDYVFRLAEASAQHRRRGCLSVGLQVYSPCALCYLTAMDLPLWLPIRGAR